MTVLWKRHIAVFPAFKRNDCSVPATTLIEQSNPRRRNIGETVRVRSHPDLISCFSDTKDEISVFSGTYVPSSQLPQHTCAKRAECPGDNSQHSQSTACHATDKDRLSVFIGLQPGSQTCQWIPCQDRGRDGRDFRILQWLQ